MPRFAEHAAQPDFLFRKDQTYVCRELQYTLRSVSMLQWAKGHNLTSTSRVAPVNLF